MRGGYSSSDDATQEALEIIALAMAYAWDDATPASSYGIRFLFGAQEHLIEKGKSNAKD